VVDKRGKVGLSAEVLERAGLVTGDRVAVSVRRDGSVLLVKVTDPLEALIGSAPGLSSSAVDVEELRGEWER
jgi:bifunctional DNA-binding transcriptional regulator/antitoxin component of YhaV-PrlF toxin-antitoxin module